jgi:hypothetical protein
MTTKINNPLGKQDIYLVVLYEGTYISKAIVVWTHTSPQRSTILDTHITSKINVSLEKQETNKEVCGHIYSGHIK